MKPLTARDAYWTDATRDMSEFFNFSTPALLKAPNGNPWTQVLKAQTTTGVCDPTRRLVQPSRFGKFLGMLKAGRVMVPTEQSDVRSR